MVVDPKNVDEFMGYAKEENLESTCVAVVTEEPRLVLSWRGREIVNLPSANSPMATDTPPAPKSLHFLISLLTSSLRKHFD